MSRVLVSAAVVGLIGFLSMPVLLYALGDVGNPECLPWNAACPCMAGINEGKKRCTTGGPNKANCSPGICKDITSGFTTKGICPAPGVCSAEIGFSLDGKSLSFKDLLGIGQLAKGLMDLLKPKEGGGAGGAGTGGGGFAPLNPLYPACIYNAATKTVSPVPCIRGDGTIAYTATETTFVNTVGSAGDDLLKLLGGTPTEETGTPKTDLNSILKTPETPAKTNTTPTATTPAGATQKTTPAGSTDVAKLKPGTAGDILVNDSGVTVVASSRDGNSEVAGFYGADARSRLQSNSIVGRFCSTRPWASGFLSAIMPATFFDGLCKWGGYQTAVLDVTSTGGGRVTTKNFIAPAVGPTAPMVTPQNLATPVVDIWAEPDRVRLGSRTYIFWNSRAVETCEATGPSFTQRTLSGGASTVPISDTTTFSITCKTVDGREVTDRVTVYLAL